MSRVSLASDFSKKYLPSQPGLSSTGNVALNAPVSRLGLTWGGGGEERYSANKETTPVNMVIQNLKKIFYHLLNQCITMNKSKRYQLEIEQGPELSHRIAHWASIASFSQLNKRYTKVRLVFGDDTCRASNS